jgi:glycosyltransferase involved in cell wall biosynthesis
MKVLISAYRCDPNKGGEELRSWTWINHYLEEGFEVVCLTNQWDKEAISNIAPFPDNLQFYFVDIPLWVERIQSNTAGVYFHYLMWQRYATRKALELHKIHKFELVHHTCWGSPQLGSGMWKLGIPFIYGPLGGGQYASRAFKKYFHNGWWEEVARFWVSRILMKFNSNAKKALKTAKIVITENFETENLARDTGANNTKMFLDAVIPFEETIENIAVKRRSDKFRILWVGRLLYRKGLPLALEAIAQLQNKMDFEFTILGDGPASKSLPYWLKKYNLEGKVNWLGQVPMKVVKEYYKKNDILLFSSLRDSSGAQLFEALSYGLPIVTLNQFGARALLPENTCIKVPVSTPEKTVYGLADAILLYYLHEDLRLEHSKNAINYIKNEYRRNIPDLIKSIKMSLFEPTIQIKSENDNGHPR